MATAYADKCGFKKATMDLLGSQQLYNRTLEYMFTLCHTKKTVRCKFTDLIVELYFFPSRWFGESESADMNYL